jgi:hypothetical protein
MRVPLLFDDDQEPYVARADMTRALKCARHNARASSLSATISRQLLDMRGSACAPAPRTSRASAPTA